MRRRAPLLLVAFAAATAAPLVACPPRNPDFTPQIRVAPGAAARMGLMGGKNGAPPRASANEKGARVHLMKRGEELGGPNAVGKPGDLVLENDEVVFVIDALGSSAGFAESGGNVVDAADARARRDELGQLFTFFGTFPRQGVYDELTSGVVADGSAFVEAKGRELYEHALKVTTRYTLRSGDRALLLETTLLNASDHAIGALRLGDAFQWGGAEKFAPGKPVGFRGPSSGAFLGGVGRGVSYAITSTEGALDAVSGTSWSDTMQTKELSLAPGKNVQYARVFVVGQRGDTASVVTELARASGAGAGEVEVTLTDESGRPVAVDEGAKAVLSLPTGEEVLSIRAAANGASFGGEVPPGTYRLTYAGGGGRRAAGPAATVTVTADKLARASLVVSGAGRLAARCLEREAPVPCKITLEGLAGTAAPDFGPAHFSGPAKNQITVGAEGAAEVPLAPGRYRVTASRGPEYALAQREEAIVAGGTTQTQLRLTRVVDTRGYVGTDFHQHTMIGADAPVGVRDRVIANAAEGVEIAVASEHNVVVDFQPLVRELGLATWLVQVAGNELTTDANKKPWGHANVFPLPVDPTKARGGATAVRERSAREVFAEIRASGEPRVLQINHPRTGITGYFDQLKLDPKTGVGTDPDYEPAFDALEVWNGRNVEARARVIDDLLTLIRTGHPVTATADTDTHGIVGHEAGYPRTYVRVANDGDFAAWDAARARDLVDGVRVRRDVLLTNGPFLRVSIGDDVVGGVARGVATTATRRGAGNARQVTVRIHVECAPWVHVDNVKIVHAVRAGAPISLPVTLTPLPTGAMAVDLTQIVEVIGDDAILLMASGSKPLTPVLAGDEKEILPFAMTGALWIDGDGDGKALGRERGRTK